MRKPGRAAIWVMIIVGGVLLALLFSQFMGYRASLRTLPAEMTVAGLDVGGMTSDQALATLESAFAQPVQLSYRDQTVTLAVENVDFRFDADGTRAAIEQAVAGRRSFDGFLAYLFRRRQAPIEIAPAATFSASRLDGFLATVARQRDHPPQPPVALPEALTFRAGLPGYSLDIEGSRAPVRAALLSAANRRAELVVRESAAPPLEMAQLEDMLNGLLIPFNGIASIFVKDLRTGEELSIGPDIAFAGTSVLKIALMTQVYRVLDEPPTVEQYDWLTDTMGSGSSNFKANLLLALVGGGDGFRGAEELTAAMGTLGLVNTFMITPYDEETLPYTVVTPANSRTDITTNPDPFMQTTAQDIGLLLEMIYQCSHGGGALLAAYPDDYTPEECQQMLDIMSQNRIDSLIEAGLPPGTPLAHKHGWGPDTHADAGIVFSPQADFVLVVYLYNPVWLEWGISNPLVNNIATATYNYFNPTP